MQPNAHAPINLTDPLITRRQLATMLHVAPGTVANWECQGRGPRGILIGRTKQYRLSTVEAWIEARS